MEQQPNLTVAFKLGDVSVKGPLSEFGQSIHFATYNGRYVALIEGDFFQFDRSMSPVELLQPPDLLEVLEVVGRGKEKEPRRTTCPINVHPGGEGKWESWPAILVRAAITTAMNMPQAARTATSARGANAGAA